MSNPFDDLRHAFEPIAHQVDPRRIESAIESGVRQVVDEARNAARRRLPGHISLPDAPDIIKIAKPDAIDVDIFAGFGVDLGVELELEFDMGVTWEQPEKAIGGIVSLIEQPPETVHQLCDRLWAIVPTEVRVYERLQAVVGEQGQVRWFGDKVLERLVAYITHRGWLERRIRP